MGKTDGDFHLLLVCSLPNPKGQVSTQIHSSCDSMHKSYTSSSSTDSSMEQGAEKKDHL